MSKELPMTTYYSLRTINPDRYVLAKFLDDAAGFNVEAVYDIYRESDADPWECNCPSGERPCKHITRIMHAFTHASKTDSDEFYCDKTSTWEKPLAADFYAQGGVDVVIGDFAHRGEPLEGLEELEDEEGHEGLTETVPEDADLIEADPAPTLKKMVEMEDMLDADLIDEIDEAVLIARQEAMPKQEHGQQFVDEPAKPFRRRV
jgi:hypothetical protein